MVKAEIETFKSLFEENVAIIECWLPESYQTYQTCIELRVKTDADGVIIGTEFLSTWGEDNEGAYEELMIDLRSKSEEELFQISTCYTDHPYHPNSVQYIQEFLIKRYDEYKNKIPDLAYRKKESAELEIDE